MKKPKIVDIDTEVLRHLVTDGSKLENITVTSSVKNGDILTGVYAEMNRSGDGIVTLYFNNADDLHDRTPVTFTKGS